MPLLKKRSYQRQSEPKLFQCTGYGDCRMTFTRSEHLARHARKHTGEKPFKCAVPGCERRFSRFDNMIQHTSTHNKNHDRKRGPNKKSSFNKKSMTSTTTTTTRQDNNTMDYTSPLTPIAGRPSNGPLLAPLASPSTKSPSPLPHISLPVSPVPEWKSPLQRLASDYFSLAHPTCLPSPKDLGLPSSPISITTVDDGSTFYFASPPLSSPSLSPRATRKLSTVELELPIHDLSVSHGNHDFGVHVSGDEFEALQGISQLSGSCHHHPLDTKITLAPLNSGVGCQVNSFRQHLELAQESNSRLSPRSSISSL
ncbi:hypothetical protein BC941DRAFT_426554 [Chlamydoabsidia padenii]|nr:hypothetical protein BC941DRAFT_426554 [Chlamydoabsidia padenii]